MRAARAVVPAAALAAVALTATGAPAAGTHSAAVPRCDVNAEHFTYFPGGGAAGTQFERFRIRHRGKSGACSLRGYPRLTLEGKQGRSLGIKIHKDRSRKVHTIVLRKQHPVWFVLAHPSFQAKSGKQCQHKVYRIQIFIPGQGAAATVKGFAPVRFCDKGARVTPFTSKPAS